MWQIAIDSGRRGKELPKHAGPQAFYRKDKPECAKIQKRSTKSGRHTGGLACMFRRCSRLLKKRWRTIPSEQVYRATSVMPWAFALSMVSSLFKKSVFSESKAKTRALAFTIEVMVRGPITGVSKRKS
jgi:hypothetical protein